MSHLKIIKVMSDLKISKIMSDLKIIKIMSANFTYAPREVKKSLFRRLLSSVDLVR